MLPALPNFSLSSSGPLLRPIQFISFDFSSFWFASVAVADRIKRRRLAMLFKKLRNKSSHSPVDDGDDAGNNNGLSRINSISSATSKKSAKSSKNVFANKLSKTLSFFSNNSSSDDLNSLATSTGDNETLELTRFKSLNYDKFPRELTQYLKFQGLSAPKILSETPTIRLSMSSSGDTVFIPSMIDISDEDMFNMDAGNGNNAQSHSTNGQSRTTLDSNDSDQGLGAGNGNTHTVLSETNPRPQHIDQSVDPVTHTFAVVVSLYVPTAVATIRAQLQASCSVTWPKGLPCDHNIKTETFEMGQTTWDLNLGNYNYFVPMNNNGEYSDEIDSQDSGSFENIDNSKFMTEQRIPLKKFENNSVEQITRAGYLNFKREDQDPFVLGSQNVNSGSVNFPPGHYVFCLPTEFGPDLPESLATLRSNVRYSLRCIVVLKNKTYDFAHQDITVIRGPPVIGVTTANKPVYINKVWSDSLNYEISFPKKYVTIGEELPIKIKLMPLEKTVSLKRIKVNIIEKVSYTSKNLEYEFEDLKVEYEDGYYRPNRKEKVITFFELKSRAKLTSAIRDELVTLPTISENLLSSSCYEPKGYNPATDSLPMEVVGPLSIRCYLPFIKPHKGPKQPPTTDKRLVNYVFHTAKLNKQVNRALNTVVQNNDIRVPTTTHIFESPEGLYPDSINNRYIHVEHKLQVSLRLSRTNPQDKKLHHYEVMIDTPLYLLSSACVPDNVDLPLYHTVDVAGAISEHLPTFEEAMSPANSPMLGPSIGVVDETINYLSRASTRADLGPCDTIDSLVDDTLDLSVDRHPSQARSDILETFRRCLTNNDNSHTDLSDGSEDSQPTGALPAEPPSYTDCQPLLNARATESDFFGENDTIDSLDTEHMDSVDLSEQFKVAAFRGSAP